MDSWKEILFHLYFFIKRNHLFVYFIKFLPSKRLVSNYRRFGYSYLVPRPNFVSDWSDCGRCMCNYYSGGAADFFYSTNWGISPARRYFISVPANVYHFLCITIQMYAHNLRRWILLPPEFLTYYNNWPDGADINNVLGKFSTRNNNGSFLGYMSDETFNGSVYVSISRRFCIVCRMQEHNPFHRVSVSVNLRISHCNHRTLKILSSNFINCVY